MVRDYYKGVTIQYNGDATQLSKVLAQINSETRQSQSAARALDAALKLDPSGLALVRDRAAETAKQVDLMKQRVDYLREALGNAEDPAVITRITQQVDIAEARLKSLQEQLVRLNAQSSMGDSGFGRAITAAGEFGQTLQDVGSKMAQVGDSATLHLTAPIVAFGAASVAAVTTVDTALTDVRKTVDGTEKQYQALKDAAIEYSKTNAVSADQVLEVQALGAQLGYSIDQLEMLGRVGSGMDIATDMGAEQATTEMAQFANITGMAKEDSERYASTIVALGNNMATTESKVSSMAQRIAAAGSQVGMTDSEILGLSAALSSVGMEAEAGGTAISTIMSQIDKDIATNSENVGMWAATAGMSAEQFAQAWKTSPVQALSALLSNMNLATQGGANMSVMLEELGVSSIRQTDALKRLAGNSQLVTDAVSLANGAWRENTALSDEVANKNDSIAAKMQMLQNRVAAIMEEIGEPLVDALMDVLDAAQPLFDMIESGAKAFSEMDEGQQRLIITTVALVAAFGPVTSVLGRVISGLSGILTSLQGAGEGFATFGASIAEGFGPMESLTLASEGLAGALTTGLVGVAIAAAVVAIGALVSAYQQWEEHNNLVRDATEGLAAATESASESFEAYAEGAESAVRDAESIRDANKEVLESLVDLAEKISDTMGEVGSNAAMAETYGETIKELGNKGTLTADELAKLKNAVDEYNSVTGAAVQITNEQTGALNVMPKALDEITAAYKRKAEQEAYAELYKDAIKEQAKAMQELDRVNAEVAKNEQILESQTSLMSDEAHSAAANLEALWQSQQDLSKATQAAGDNVSYWGDKISAVSGKVGDVETAMTAAGVTGEQAANLTEDQLRQIRDAFDGTIDSIMGKLQEFGVVSGTGSAATNAAQQQAAAAARQAQMEQQRALQEAAAIQRQAEQEAQAEQRRAAQEQQQAQREANEAIIAEQQRANEEFYDARSKELEKEYDLESKSYERAYKQRQKQLEKELKQLQKSLAEKTKARQAELKAAEDLERKKNERLIATQRKANEQQESELKSAQDKRYKQLKASLDKEIDALSDANRKKIKSLKDEQAAETKAYKAETSARIKEMDREYKAKVKLLEENDGTKKIDARIKELQQENDAEDRAAKERQQQEKVAELQSAVEKAKSRRKRAEAERELNDYLAEIAKEAREQERKDEIDRLNERKDAIKEETAAKKDALKEQYDQQKTEYETQRAEQLEREDKQREEDYERLAASLDHELEIRREAADKRLEAQKLEDDANVARMAELHEQQETAYKEMLDNRLQAMSDAHDLELEKLSEQQTETLEKRREGNAETLEALRESQSEALKNLKDSQKEELKSIKDSQKAQLDALRKGLDSQVGSIGTAMSNAAGAVDAAAAQMVNTADTKSKEATKKLDEGTKPMPENTKKTVKLTRDEFFKKVNEIPGLAKNSGDSAGKSLVERLNAHIIPTGNASKGLRDAANRDVKNLPSDYKQKGGESGRNLASELNAKQGTVSTSAKNVASAAKNPFDPLPGIIGGKGGSAASNFASGISSNAWRATDSAHNVASGVADHLSSPANSSEMWGSHMMGNLNNGIVNYWNNTLLPNLQNIAQSIANLLAHSKPKEGPLKDDDLWFYHLGQNLDSGLRRSVPALMGTVEGLASGVADGMDVDVASAIARSMADGEGELSDQAARVARILSDGLDPISSMTERLADSVRVGMDDARNELARQLDRMASVVDAGTLAMSSRLDANLNYARSAYSQQRAQPLAFAGASNVSISFDVHLDGMVISNDLDMRQVSRGLADEATRELAANLGLAVA